MSGKHNGLIKKALDYLKEKKTRKGQAHRMNGRSLRHQMRGEVKTYNVARRNQPPDFQKRGTGYHYRPGGHDLPGRRTTITKRHPNGVYEGTPEFQNSKPPPTWVPKNGNGKSAFFPDTWGPRKIDDATSSAFKNGTKNDDGTWSGEYDGVKINGFWDPATGKIGHGFPAWVDEQ